MRLSFQSLSLLCLTTLALGAPACGDDGSGTGEPATSGDPTGAADSTGNPSDPDPTSTSSPTGDPTGDPTSESDPTEAPPNCGDGKLDAGEQCDAGAANSNTGLCTAICTNANCGDGWVQTGVEECDDGNNDYSDACAASCRLQVCGDGHLGKGEGCDDGNDVDDDGCSNDCAPSGCGNGMPDAGEGCDDGNEVNTDKCLNTCQVAVCGDLVVWTGTEECDDGNDVDDDGCTNQCTMGGVGPACGDGMKNGDETDVDCGGGCNGCGDGLSCNEAADCTSGTCTAGVCEPGGNQVKLEPVNCAPAMVGIDAAFTGAIMGNCGCHGGGQGGLTFSDAASFKDVTVNVKSNKSSMNRVTPGNIDESYVLYKLHGQQNNAPGGAGSLMPLGGAQLSDDKLCLMINWVKSI